MFSVQCDLLWGGATLLWVISLVPHVRARVWALTWETLTPRLAIPQLGQQSFIPAPLFAGIHVPNPASLQLKYARHPGWTT